MLLVQMLFLFCRVFFSSSLPSNVVRRSLLSRRRRSLLVRMNSFFLGGNFELTLPPPKVRSTRPTPRPREPSPRFAPRTLLRPTRPGECLAHKREVAVCPFVLLLQPSLSFGTSLGFSSFFSPLSPSPSFAPSSTSIPTARTRPRTSPCLLSLSLARLHRSPYIKPRCPTNVDDSFPNTKKP